MVVWRIYKLTIQWDCEFVFCPYEIKQIHLGTRKLVDMKCKPEWLRKTRPAKGPNKMDAK